MKTPLRCILLILLGLLWRCAGPSRHVDAAAPGRSLSAAPTAASEVAGPPSPTDAPAVVIDNATVFTAQGAVFSPGHIAMAGGRIVAVGPGAAMPQSGAHYIDAHGQFVTPGLIDTHSHMGVYPIPRVPSVTEVNEDTGPVTADVWAEHGFWTQDPGLRRAVSDGGVTTIQVLPGSANLIGGRSMIAKLRPRNAARQMRFPGAVPGLKMACGENPKGVYGGRNQFPSTRMGNVAGMRRAFVRAHHYRHTWHAFARELRTWQQNHPRPGPDDEPPEPPERDLAMETLVEVLDGNRFVHAHCYRADDMHALLDVAHAMGFKIRAFHHAVEAYKMADRLAAEQVAVSTWADWWGFKMEALDGLRENVGMLTEAGVLTTLHSDSEVEIRTLNQEAAKAQSAARQAGIAIDDDQAMRWVTANPARVLGIDAQTGTLEVGKMADAVLWDHHPLSVYARPRMVFIDGEVVFNRDHGAWVPSDFELGQP